MISFNSLTKAQYDALSAITTDRIYFLTDTGELKLNGVDYGASELSSLVPSGGTVGQVLTKTETGSEWADAQGGEEVNPAYVELENKTASAPATFEVDFSGKQIQKYAFEDAASGSIAFTVKNSGASGDGYAPTVELQIPVSGEISTITLPEGAQVVDMPASLTGELSNDRIKKGITYHDLVFRNEKNFAGHWQTYISHGYSFQELEEYDYFWLEAREDDSTVSCDNFNASYKLSSSFDKITWTPLIGSTIATGVNAGTKIYFIGNTTTLGSETYTAGWRPYSDKKYAIGGKILSLYNDLIEPVALTNDYDLSLWQSSKSLLEECSVDFGPVKYAYSMFMDCSNLSALPFGFSVHNSTNTNSMFYSCSKLSGLPDGFSCPNATNTAGMFSGCSNLSGLPDGFSVPNSTITDSMFHGCSKLSGLPDGFSCPNATETYFMFYECSNLSSLPDGFSCPNATNTKYMFNGCTSLSALPDGFSCPNATNTSIMFNGCSNLSALPDGFSCPNTTDTNSMFGYTSLSALPDGFRCPNTTITNGMFSETKLSGLPDGFSCPNATNTGGMFYHCYSLSGLPDGFSCPNATDTNSMFYECSNLSSLPDGFSCPNATDTSNMFNNCYNLSGLPDGFSCPNTTSTWNMFSISLSLTTIGNNVKIANGPNATATDDTDMYKHVVTTIGSGFEWFTNATFDGTWDPALGIRNVFPNAVNVGPGWKVYNHYDGE